MTRILVLLCFFAAGPQAAAEQMTGEEIVELVRKEAQLDSAFMEQAISTCRYRVVANKLKCIERPERKEFHSAFKNYSEDRAQDVGIKSRSIVILTQPTSEMGISFLQFDYAPVDRDSDQWIYIPAFSRIKRVVTNQSNTEQSGLFGSEIDVSDLRSSQDEKYSYTVVGEEQVSGESCWVIEVNSHSDGYLRGTYSKIIIYVAQANYRVLKEQLFDRRGQLFKEIVRRDFQERSGAQIAATTIVNNVQKERVTILEIKRLAVNIEVDDELISKRAMEDEAFRQRQIAMLNKAL